jgi:hypothetical protein
MQIDLNYLVAECTSENRGADFPRLLAILAPRTSYEFSTLRHEFRSRTGTELFTLAVTHPSPLRGSRQCTIVPFFGLLMGPIQLR